MSAPQNDPKEILVFNVNWLGDVIFSIPVFKALRKNYPQASITCLAVPRVKEILECVPGIDEIIIYDEKGKDRGLFAKINLIRCLRQKSFDTVFLLHGSWSRALLMLLANIPTRVGYQKKGRSRFLTHPVEPVGDEVHKADIYLNVIESFGVPVWDKTSQLNVPAEAKEAVVKMLTGNDIKADEPFIVVHTSGNWNLKRWPSFYWAELIKILMTELRIKVVISEGPKELEWAKEIAKQSQVTPVILAGKTNLQELIALMEKAVLVISADSGPLHIASCVNHNVIGIYGPTMPSTTAPRGKAKVQIFHKDVGCNRASCYYLACPDNICMQAVTVEDVFTAAKRILGN